MKNKIRSKMEEHIKSILSKPIINDQEYMLLAGYLSKLEFEEAEKDNAKKAEESQKQFREKIANIFGGEM